MTFYVLSGFNNYYNRLVKRFDTLEEYESFILHTQQNFNFVPNDNVNTQVVLGSNVNLYDGTGDYLLVVNELNEIVSRWFIIESVRDRAGQYTLTLHRDLVADHYTQLLDAPMYIEKAIVGDNDPAIWNNETVSVNQIKTKEFTLQDDTRCAWLVGYFSREYDGFSNFEFSVTNPPVYATMTESEFQQLKNNNGKYLVTNYTFGFNHTYTAHILYDSQYSRSYVLDGNTLEWTQNSNTISGLATTSITPQKYGDIYEKTLSKFNRSVNSKIIDIAKMSASVSSGNIITESKFNELLSYNNKTIKVTSETNGDQYYTITSSRKPGVTLSWTIQNDLSSIDGISAIPTYLKTKISENANGEFAGSITGRVYEYSDTLSLSVKSVQTADVTFSMKSKDNRTHLEDAPYDMFCIPYKEEGLNVILGSDLSPNGQEPLVGRTLSKISALSFAQGLAEKMSTNLFDLQLLPYCPITNYTMIDNVFICRDLTAKDIDHILLDNNVIIPLLYCNTSQGTINSEQLHLIDTATGAERLMPIPLLNKKLDNECDMYRLCSPNYNGQFQFTASKMNGIKGFNVDYTYLPYTPYIHINPNFSGLYGKDFDDARGLICQGDFSICYLSDAWENYQVQNKNYLNIFNRGTENLETTQEVQRTQQIFNAVTGTLMGGAGGALTGSKGGLPGMIAGAVVGTAASAVGGALDVQYGDMLRNEALDYRQDLFNYQLDNIKALPDSIARTTAYTYNNKIFPILEYYTCTDIEKKAIAEKIAYNSMTVGRVGTLNEFVGNRWVCAIPGLSATVTSKGYIKGKLIRLETVEDDYHIINALSGELDKGVFINQ